jgi:branched-chain amino acid transport system permease protein
MTVATLLQLLINGVLFGTMYGIAAIGLSVIFGMMHILFLAQGTMIVLAAYCCYWLFELYGMNPYLSALVIVPAFLLLGQALYHGLFRRVSVSGAFPSLLIAFGLMSLLENLISVLWSPNPRAIVAGYSGYSISLSVLHVSFTRLMAFVMAMLAAGGVTLFLKKTLLGKAVRAASENMEYAMLVGITPHRANGVAFAVGMGLAGLAGVATATVYPFDPNFGFIFSLKAMIALALGGMGSVMGALAGGILLGAIESFSSYVFSGAWADAIGYALFLMVLMFKPEGLFSPSPNGNRK